MNYQTLITAVALIPLPFALLFASAEPKGYEIVDYKGKGPGVTVAFEFAERLLELQRDQGHRTRQRENDKVSIAGWR